ncbi:FecR family protein [Malonomonas rubra DSM 5091]|uniref:FecR family protein n=1 Tax=Malonomonas rubra DSM 5091 TaxID=1122189 RepID=A0A1M6FED0_MALRU|nr:FecR domain-containing protein [Malonomonas rubra]SHI96047.1 FecR family protein [Malonomonas rubra DSM 5091]
MRYVFGLLLVLFFAATLSAAQSIGTVKTLTGSAFVERQGEVVELEVGAPLQVADRVVTRADGSLGLILQDDTTVSLGPDSELLLRAFVFEPKQNRFSMILKMLKGTFLYVSGVIGKLAPDSIELETPDSTIAVRGTRVLIKVSN